MGSGGVCHECGKYRCVCPYDIVEDARKDFLRDILRACKPCGVTIEFDFERAEEVGMEEPAFVSATLTESGHGFIVGLSDIEDALRKSNGQG